MSKTVGYAVATLVAGLLVSEIFPTLRDAERLARRLGCKSYVAVEVRA